MNHLLTSFILALIISASSLPVAAVDPEAEENGAAASGTATAVAVDASPQAPLELLPLEIQYKILESLSPKEVNSVAITSKVMSNSVFKFRAHCRETYQHHVKTVMRVHESNPAGYGLPMFASRTKMEARIPSQKLQQVPSAYKEQVWRGECRVSFDIFAATPNNPVYEIADRMADYQKANMADVMLAAMYPEEAPSYLEKAAIHHLFSAYTVFHKEDSLAGWRHLLPSKKEGLQQFIAETYVEFEPGQVPAVRPDQKLVVKHSQLDEDPNIEALNGIFQPGHPQPEMVLDFEGEDQTAGLDEENLPAQLKNLAIINSGGSITQIEDEFLSNHPHLKTVTLSLPQLTEIGDFFLSSNSSLKTVTLSLPRVTQAGRLFLSRSQNLETLTLNLPQLTHVVGDGFLACNRSLTTVTLSLPQLTHVVGNGFLSKNPSLKTVTLNLPQLTQIGKGFLFENQSLETLTLSLPKVEQVENSFLAKCQSLETLTLSLPELTQVGDCFLWHCESLKTLTLSLPQVTQIEMGFLFHCQSLESLTLNLPQVAQVGKGFLAKCQSLESLTLNLPQVSQVGRAFLFKCLQLKSVDLRSLLKLEKVDIDFFMSGMTKLEKVLIEARQEEFFKELLKNRPDLISKFMIAA